MKLLAVTFEVEHCSECSKGKQAYDGDWVCLLKQKLISVLWGDIPNWCPLPEKEEELNDRT